MISLDRASARTAVPAPPPELEDAVARAASRAGASRQPVLVTWTRPARLAGPLRAPPASAAPRAFFRGPDGTGISALGAAATLVAGGAARFEVVRVQARALLRGAVRVGEGEGAPGPRFLGGVAFQDDHRPDGVWQGFSGATFLLPAVALTVEAGRAWVTVNRLVDAGERAPDVAAEMAAAAELATLEGGAQPPRPPRGATLREPEGARDAWIAAVRRALDAVAAGRFEKTVLARRVPLELAEPLCAEGMLERLAGSYPECFLYLFEPEPGALFLGATPERLVRLRGLHVESVALAGSAARGRTPDEDAKLAEALLASPKERSEHDIVVRHVRDRLAALRASVKAPPSTPEVLRLRNVQHLRTPVEAALEEPAHVLDLASVLHPTPAVAGAPVRKAVTFLRDAEPFDRGWYAGAVGWFEAEGGGEIAVALRCILARGREVSLFAGAGIVEGADPEREWDETLLKLQPMLEVLGCLP